MPYSGCLPNLVQDILIIDSITANFPPDDLFPAPPLFYTDFAQAQCGPMRVMLTAAWRIIQSYGWFVSAAKIW
jgi:hypothetical protein